MKALLLSFLMIFGVNVAADEMPKKVETDKQNWNFDGDIFMWAVLRGSAWFPSQPCMRENFRLVGLR